MADDVAVATLTVDEFLKLNDLESFLEKWVADTPVALNKNRDFYNWRLRSPGSNYGVVCLRDRSGHLIQVVIVRSTILRGVPSLCILDWMRVTESLTHLRICHYSVLEFARQSNCEVIALMMSGGHADRFSIRKLGFIRTPAVFTLIIKNLTGVVSDAILFDERRWAIMWIDTDNL
jgi:hypothetical protein